MEKIKVILRKMREYHTGLLAVAAGWALLLYICLFLTECEYEIILSRLSFLPMVFSGVVMAGAAALTRWFLKAPWDSQRVWTVAGVFFGLPTVLAVLRYVTMDYLYDFTGVFLGGLGVALGCLAAVILAPIAGIVFGISYYAVRKRRTQGKDASRGGILFENVVNVLPILAVIICIVIFGGSLLSDFIYDLETTQRLARNEKFRKALYATTEANEAELSEKSYKLAMYTTVAREEEDALLLADTLSGEEMLVLKQGIADYLRYAEEYPLESDFKYETPDYDGARQRATCKYLFEISDANLGTYRDVYLILEYDVNGALVHMYCEDIWDYER